MWIKSKKTLLKSIIMKKTRDYIVKVAENSREWVEPDSIMNELSGKIRQMEQRQGREDLSYQIVVHIMIMDLHHTYKQAFHHVYVSVWRELKVVEET